MTDTPPEQTDNPRELSQLITLTHVVYGLLGLSLVSGFFFPLTAIIAVIINYVKLDETQGTWLAAHFRWQIRTFWFGLLWYALGWIFFLTVIGIPLAWLLWFIAAVWVLYRIVKGWLKLNDKQPVKPAVTSS